jgi:hypothetical protein
MGILPSARLMVGEELRNSQLTQHLEGINLTLPKYTLPGQAGNHLYTVASKVNKSISIQYGSKSSLPFGMDV